MRAIEISWFWFKQNLRGSEISEDIYEDDESNQDEELPVPQILSQVRIILGVLAYQVTQNQHHVRTQPRFY